MKNIRKLMALIIMSNHAMASYSDSLVAITKQEFERGRKENPLSKDLAIKKSKNILRVGGCKSFKDNERDDNFYQFDYIGDIDKNLHLKIIKKTLYNGEEYLIADIKNECKIYKLLGRPHVCGSIIVNFNESETTDRNNY